MQKFFEKFGCLIEIIVIVGFIVLCNKVDTLYYLTHKPVSYCKKFPSGKHQEVALDRIVKKINSNNGIDYFYNTFKTQKAFADFIEPLAPSIPKLILRGISEDKYKTIKQLAQEEIIPTSRSWKKWEDSVEDKYKPEIAAIRADLERRWKNETYAWKMALKRYDPFFHYKKEVLEQYLEYHPNGQHALEVNRMLVEYLQDELEAQLD